MTNPKTYTTRLLVLHIKNDVHHITGLIYYEYTLHFLGYHIVHITITDILRTNGNISKVLKTSITMFNRFKGNHEEAKTTTMDTNSECVRACFLIFSCNLEFCRAIASSLLLLHIFGTPPVAWLSSCLERITSAGFISFTFVSSCIVFVSLKFRPFSKNKEKCPNFYPR